MTPELPASNIDGTDELMGNGARVSTAPARSVPGKRAASPRSSSGKYPLPGPWPDPEQDAQPLLMIESQPVVLVVDDTPAVPVVTQKVVADPAPTRAAPSAPPPAPPRVSPRKTRKVTRDLALERPAPPVKQDQWLPKPDYWMTDHQIVTRPRTRPIPRPQRFARVSRTRSTMLLLVSVIGAGLLGAGMVMAGNLTYQFFNTPVVGPISHPATATSTAAPATATATEIPVTVTATDAVQQTFTPEIPTATP